MQQNKQIQHYFLHIKLTFVAFLVWIGKIHLIKCRISKNVTFLPNIYCELGMDLLIHINEKRNSQGKEFMSKVTILGSSRERGLKKTMSLESK